MNLLALMIVFTSVAAHARHVVLRNPTFQGRPIALATPTIRNFSNFQMHIERNELAHTVCRLAGHTGAVLGYHDFMRRDVPVQTGAEQIRTGEAFLPSSILANARNRHLSHSADMDIWYGVVHNLNPRATPRFRSVRSIAPCAEMLSCRSLDRRGLLGILTSFEESVNNDHPLIQQCSRWVTRDEDVMLLASITCNDSESVSGRELTEEVRAFHAQTGNRFRVVENAVPHELTRLADRDATCNRHREITRGSLSAPMHSCEYPMSMMDSIEAYMLVTGRISFAPKPGPACVQRILSRYAGAVVRPEYGIGDRLDLISRPFCVESQSQITTTATGCSFQVQTQDMLRVPVTLNISLQSEGAAPARCEELAECFAHEELTCQKANFCPSPGLMNRQAQ